MATEAVHVRLRFKRDDSLPPGECMWAEPIATPGGEGTYRLLNSSFFAPLAAGDTVRAAVDGHGGLQVTDVVRPGDRVLTIVEYGPQVPREEVRRVADSWVAATDGWSEGVEGVLFTIWAEGMSVQEVGQVLQASIGGSRDWNWHATLLPGDRTRDRQCDLDFELDRRAVSVPDTW